MKKKIKRISISNIEFYSNAKLVNHTEIRNTIIRAFWEGLKYSELSYIKRRKIICKEFYISENLVDRIITRNC